MASFKDSKGNNWDLSITVGSRKRVKSRLDYDLIKLVSENLKELAELRTDPEKLVNIVYVLCEAQCKERQISDEDFGCLFDGDTWMAAQEALEVELVNFFRNISPTFVRALRMSKEAAAKMLQEVDEKLAAITTDQIIEEVKRTSANKLMTQ